MVDLTADLGFLKLKNPVLTASGTFGYGLEFAPFIDLGRLGGIIVKGLYYGPRPGNPPPRLAETPSGMLNAIGLQGIGVVEFSEKILPRLRGLGTEVIVNVCGGDTDEYAAVVEYLDAQEGIAAYELNISCPNVKKNGQCPALRPDATQSLVRAVKRRSRRPVIVKLSPNVTDIVEIARAAEEGGADALSLVNTFLGMAVDLDSRRPVLANVLGGLSGPAIKPLALRMVYQVARAVELPVIGLGGIMTGRDALEFLLVGARAVQVGTANLVDPEAAGRVLQEMQDYAEHHGLARLADITGKLEV
jgi:dihydroorotate dehydrogenase (NAD+) catalytic subunit